MNKVTTNHWDAAIFDPSVQTEAYRMLHRDKIDATLREMMVTSGLARESGQWMSIPEELSGMYMSFLAQRMAGELGLNVISDSSAAWLSQRYFEYDGTIESAYHDESLASVSLIVLRDFIPDNILGIEPERLLRFREEYEEERRNFVSAVEDFASKLSECSEPAILPDLCSDLSATARRSLGEYKDSMRTLDVLGWGGIKVLSFPLLTEVAAHMGAVPQEAQSLLFWSGLTVGARYGMMELSEKRRNLGRNSPFSYLHHVRERLSTSQFVAQMHGNMHEFIDD